MKILIEDIDKIIINETYIYYDQPLAYSFFLNEKLFFAYAWGYEEECFIFLFIETNQEKLNLLVQNKICIKSFIRDSTLNSEASEFFFNKEKTRVEYKFWKDLEKDCYIKENIFLMD